jgi:PTS system nitrogen regulatory IIA component
MKIMDFLNEKAVSVDLRSKDKRGVISELVDLLASASSIKNKDGLIKALMARESLGSTGIGQNIGIPHAKSDSVKQLTAAFGISREGINFDSLDGEPAHIFFLLVAPEDSAGPHLKALASISRLLKDKFVRDALKNAGDRSEVIKLIKSNE